ncbi:MAG: RICIN domain-containing protein [Eubacterium sp.]
MYVILDMHGAFGSQNGMDHSGEINDGKQLYYNQSNKDKTLNLWKKIAEHFKGNPAVAAYDILNEPGIKAAATYSLHWDFYNEIYNTIRSKDRNHIIIMESCWDADNLPRPSQYGWTNVAYEYHYYPWSAQNSSDAQKSYFSSKVSDIANHNYGVPTFVGEFTCFEQAEGWKAAMSTFNSQGWHWTTWSYKVTGNSSWGIYNHNPEKVDIYNDSADTIKNKWSAVGTANGWKNDKIYNLVKPYLSGTVTSTGGSTTDDSDNNSTSGVATLYEHSNYGGRAVSLEEGSYDYKDILAKGIVNDQISSLRVSNGYKVTIYDDEGFKGTSKEFTSDASYVGDEMNDKTSSIKIEKINNQTSTTTSYDTVKLPNGKYSIKSVANEKYVAAENGGSDPIVANRDNYSGSWETFYIVNNDDGTVSIKADANNKYVCAVLDEENQLTPRSDSISTWEKFKIYKINDSEYGIRSAENRKYVKADLDNGGKLIAGSDSIAGAWEAFNIEKVGDTTTNDNVATFYENSNYGGWSVSLPEGTYDYRDIIAKGIKNDAISSLKVNSGYKVTLYNNAGFNGTSKAFTGDASYVGDEMNDKTSSIKIEKWDGSSSVTYNTVKLSNGKYSIKSVANGKYVAAENGGSETIVANRDSYGGSWETFYLINNDDGTVSIKADANNKYVCAVLDEENQLVPRSESVGTWEKFQIYKISDTEYGLKSAENGKYVKADLDNGGKLIAGSDSIAGAWEAFNIEKLGDETSSAKATFYENSNYSGWSVALSEGRYDYGTMISKGIKNDQISSVKVADGYKVTLYNDAGFAGSKKTLFTDASGLGDFNDKTSAIVIEKVEKADFNNSNAYITSIANGQVVCAENGGSETIVANRSSCGGAWETFQIVTNDDGTVSLRSVSNGKYVCAVIDEKNQLLPRSGSIGTWEKFIIEKISDGEYALYSLANGKYVQANLNDGGKLFATSETVAGAWEVFDISRN